MGAPYFWAFGTRSFDNLGLCKVAARSFSLDFPRLNVQVYDAQGRTLCTYVAGLLILETSQESAR